MKDIEVINNKEGYDYIRLMFEEGIMRISYERNLDLYWDFIPNCKFLESKEEYTLSITKLDYYFYNLIDKLFFRIENDYVYNTNEKEKSDWILFRKNELLKDNKIIWISDDAPENTASSLTIEKCNGKYLITFKKGHDQSLFSTFAVRISNSGSRYVPYNSIFMQMFKDLTRYDGQITIDEYISVKKLMRKNK